MNPPVQRRPLPPGWRLRSVLALLLVGVVVVLGFTGFSLAGGNQEARGYSTLGTGSARVLSCEDAGRWFLLAQQSCTAEVTLDQPGPAQQRTLTLARGQLGAADVGRSVDVALLSPDRYGGRFRYLYDDDAVLVRNQDRPLRAFSDVVLTLVVLAVGVALTSTTRRLESARNPVSVPSDRLATRVELRTVSRSAVGLRVRALWWTARVGVVVSLAVGVVRTPTVAVAGVRSDVPRWPGLEDALALPFYAPILFCLVLWAATAYLRAAQRSEAVWVLRDGVAGIADNGLRAVRLWDVRTADQQPRRRPRAAAAVGVVGVVVLVVAARALGADQPWWVGLAGFAQAAVVLAVAVALVLPSPSHVQRVRALLLTGGHPLPTDDEVERQERRMRKEKRTYGLWNRVEPEPGITTRG